MDTKIKIMDIAMNLNRIGNWAADGFGTREKRILTFLKQTSGYLHSLEKYTFTPLFQKTFDRFLQEYIQLEEAGKQGPKDEQEWAEKMMTWGNILTHRVKLIK